MRRIHFTVLSAAVLALAGCSNSHSVVESNAAPFLKIGQDYCVHFSNGLVGGSGNIRVLGVSGDFVQIESINAKEQSADHPKTFWINERLINAVSKAPCKGS